MRVIEKPKVFDAVQVRQRPEHGPGPETSVLMLFDEHDRPAWLERAVDHGVIRRNVFEASNHPPELLGVLVETDLGTETAFNGRWIMSNERGELAVVTDAYFTSHYARVDDAAPDRVPASATA